MIGTIFSASKNPTHIKEILVFLGVLALLFSLILVTKGGAGQMGICDSKSCSDFQTAEECNLAPIGLECQTGRCENVNCWNLRTESECNSEQICEWNQNRCSNIQCYSFSTESECTSQTSCQWNQNGCSNIACFDFKTELLCENNECNWNNDYCRSTNQSAYYLIRQDCRNYNNQKDNCLDQELCKWRPSYGFFSASRGLPTILWLLWILNNFIFIGFIILIIWYGQNIGSIKIINLGLVAFILQILSRYIGFWMSFGGYFAFSVLAILGGLMLIVGAWLIPVWRRRILDKTNQIKEAKQ